MSSIESKDDGTACIICFKEHRRCNRGEKLCCSGASPNQLLIDASPRIGEDAINSSIISKLRGWSLDRQSQLASGTNSKYTLKCLPSSDVDIGTFHTLVVDGVIDSSNKDLIARVDKMIADIFAPKIQTANGAPKSISLTCLGIGYCNMLIFTNLQDSSGPRNQHDLSPILAEVAIKRIDEIIASLMSSVRYVQHELDKETRPGLVLWYLYLSDVRTKLQELGRCQAFDDLELYNHVQNMFTYFRKELRKRFKTDCKNKAQWNDGLTSQRDLEKKICPGRFWTLSLTLIPLSNGIVGKNNPYVYSNSFDTPVRISDGHRLTNRVNLLAIGQPPPDSVLKIPGLGAISDKDSKMSDERQGDYGPDHNFCVVPMIGKANIRDGEAKHMPQCGPPFQVSTQSAGSTLRSDNWELGWDHDFFTLSKMCSGIDTTNCVALFANPQVPLANPVEHNFTNSHAVSSQPGSYQNNTSWDLINRPIASADTGINANIWNSARCGLVAGIERAFDTSMNRVEEPCFTENTDMFIDPRVLTRNHPQHDDLGKSDTFNLASVSDARIRKVLMFGSIEGH